MHQRLGMLIVLYVCLRILVSPPTGPWRLWERWQQWRRGKGWHVGPHTPMEVVELASATGGKAYMHVCHACGHEGVVTTEEEVPQHAAHEARWRWVRLTLAWGLLPIVRELTRVCTFVGALVVASALLLLARLGRRWTICGPERHRTRLLSGKDQRMSMARLVAGTFACTLMVGCTMHTQGGQGETSTRRTTESPEVAYATCLDAVLQEGGAIQTTVDLKLISARFHHGVTLHVILNPVTGGGSSIMTSAKLDGGKVAFGGVTVGEHVAQRGCGEPL